MKDDARRFLPLAPATLHILLALAGEELHGYGIMQEVARQSEGRYTLGPGTLYDNLQRMLDHGLVREVSRRGASHASNDDPRRRYYRLSSLGRSVLSGEIARLEGVVRDARLRLQTAKPRGA
jgi:DNA-binding PadR family transcriptional regulator